jgi:hypothetical protein
MGKLDHFGHVTGGGKEHCRTPVQPGGNRNGIKQESRE